MARIPHGAKIVKNPVSGAPGFQMENVFTLAGVPQIARAMLEDIGHRLEGGARVHKVQLRGPGLREGDLAEPLGAIAKAHPDVSIGSYPWYLGMGDNGVALVARSTDTARLETVRGELEALMRGLGVEPVLDPA
jgi:molybdopterin-biosynthesis enzyme MoeA-like protein